MNDSPQLECQVPTSGDVASIDGAAVRALHRSLLTFLGLTFVPVAVAVGVAALLMAQYPSPFASTVTREPSPWTMGFLWFSLWFVVQAVVTCVLGSQAMVAFGGREPGAKDRGENWWLVAVILTGLTMLLLTTLAVSAAVLCEFVIPWPNPDDRQMASPIIFFGVAILLFALHPFNSFILCAACDKGGSLPDAVGRALRVFTGSFWLPVSCLGVGLFVAIGTFLCLGLSALYFLPLLTARGAAIYLFSVGKLDLAEEEKKPPPKASS